VKTKLLFIIDQLIFSASNFILFFVADATYTQPTSNAFSLMLSASALAFNVAFALSIEPPITKRENNIDQYDLAIGATASILLCYIGGKILWPDFENNLLLSAAAASCALLWLSRKACILDESRLSSSIFLTTLWLATTTAACYLAPNAEIFFYYYTSINTLFIITLCSKAIRKNRDGGPAKLREIRAKKKLYFSSVLLAPLLWFPSNGIYPILSFAGSNALADTRKILMLLSPSQQGASAIASYIFSRRTLITVPAKNLLTLAVPLASVNTLLAFAFILLFGRIETTPLLWAVFFSTAILMIAITTIQSVLRAHSHQSSVVISLAVGAATQILAVLLIPAPEKIDALLAISIILIGYATIATISAVAYARMRNEAS
tara:strand:- start:1823 stop:2953 length:1131 start_codon:yes stop_codon:yes gene_type:complete